MRPTVLTAIGAAALVLLPVAKAADQPNDRTAITPARLQALAASPRDASFEVYPHEIASVAFAASQPGPIRIAARWKGAPLTVVLHSRAHKLAEARGETEADIQYSLTEADLKDGSLWTVSLLISAPTHASSPLRAAERNPAAEGTLHIEHPPADAGKLEGDLRVLYHKTPPPPRGGANTVPWAALRQAAYVQERAAVHAAVLKSAEEEFASGRSSNANNAPPLVLLLFMPPPTIGSLNNSAGDPGTPVLICGSGFGDQPGEVHFVVAANNDQAAPLETGAWTDTQVLAFVPSVEGVPAFDGFVYVKTAAGLQSELKPFHFIPTLDHADLDIYGDTSDQVIDGHPGTSEMWPGRDLPWTSGVQVSHEGDLPFGGRGTDGFYRDTQLKNGWVVDQVRFRNDSQNGAGATVKASYENTSLANVEVHWWYDALNLADYRLVITIRGPKGLPFR